MTIPGYAYTEGMEKNLTRTTKTFAILALTVLLVTPPASAKTKTAKTVKINSEAARFMSLGLGNLERGENSAAISAFTKAARRQGSVSTYFLLGWSHYQRGFKAGGVDAADRDDAQSAIDAFAMALSLDPSLKDLPEPSKLYFSLALCYEAVGSLEKAADSYKMAFRASPKKALIPLHAARLRLKMGDGAKAMSNVEIALRKAQAAGQTAALRAAAQNDPSFKSLMASAPHRKAMGIAAIEDGDMVADARSGEMRDAIRDTPRPAAPAQDPEVLEKVALGNLELKFRRFNSAIVAFHEALAMDQERMTLSIAQTAALYEKIGFAYNKLGQSEIAVRALQKSLQQNPINPSAQYQIALAYGVSGKTGAALRALDESFKACAGPSDLRRFVMLSKTDGELEAVRDMAGYNSLVAEYADRIALR